MIRTKFEDTERIWFTSDTHFDHANIIRYCERPFSDVNEMNEEMIRMWNERIGEDDIVFHLGDFSWSNDWRGILERLNGKIYLVLGNHDLVKFDPSSTSLFEAVTPKLTIKIGRRMLILNHEPLLTFGGIDRSNKRDLVFQPFGHVHSKKGLENTDSNRLQILSPTQYDVGVDNNDYHPISWKELEDIINKQIDNSKK